MLDVSALCIKIPSTTIKIDPVVLYQDTTIQFDVMSIHWIVLGAQPVPVRHRDHGILPSIHIGQKSVVYAVDEKYVVKLSKVEHDTQSEATIATRLRRLGTTTLLLPHASLHIGHSSNGMTRFEANFFPRFQGDLSEVNIVSRNLSTIHTIVTFLSSVIDELSELGLVHGDIKLENILVTHEQGTLRVVLSDIESITVAGTNIVTPHLTPLYCHPERRHAVVRNLYDVVYACYICILLFIYPYRMCTSHAMSESFILQQLWSWDPGTTLYMIRSKLIVRVYNILREWRTGVLTGIHP